MPKPTPLSVTKTRCTCGFLEQQADDPDSPIVFDAQMNEYHFEYPSPCADVGCDAAKAQMMIYHCPMCGGAAPPSKRASMFTTVSRAESRRLNGMFTGLRTLQEVIEKFGPPEDDLENGAGVQEPAKDGAAPTWRSYRTLLYARLSDTADVQVYSHPGEGAVRVALLCKYIGPPVE